jgi:hypothetical protein
MINVYTILLGNLEGNGFLPILVVDGRIILKCMLRKLLGFNWVRIRFNRGLL